MEEKYRINFSAPNLVNVCIDRRGEGGCEGRLYCGYYPQAISFYGEYAIIKIMEKLMDAINYPQVSTITRCYKQKKFSEKQEWRRIFSGKEIMKEKGKLTTLAIYVQYRQNSTWQGELFWSERNMLRHFRSVLELLKLIDQIAEYREYVMTEHRTTDYSYKIPKNEGGVVA